MSEVANQHLIKRLDAIQQTLSAQYSGGRGLPNTTAGSEREAFLREFLQKVFPAHRRFSTGAITDAQGGISGQVDIVVEYPFVPSFPLPSTDERLLLAESVAMAIEVKSDLISQWGQVRETVKKVKALRRQLNPLMVLDEEPAAFSARVSSETIPCVVVGYAGHTTTAALSKRLRDTPKCERPDAALVIRSGCFCGFDMEATGASGLYVLCVAINSSLNSLGAAAPNLLAYTDTEEESN